MLLRVETTQDRGRVVVATADLQPGVIGLQLLAETAIIVVPPYDNRIPSTAIDQCPRFPEELQSKMDPNFWASYWCYKSQPDEIQAMIRDFYTELDCSTAKTIRRLVTPVAKVYDVTDIDEFVHISMVFHFNAVTVNPPSSDGHGAGTNYGRGLFEIACRMSHSCKPNCSWISSQDGTQKLVRLIAPVKQGEELTISYTDCLLLPTHTRRQALLRSKNFCCNSGKVPVRCEGNELPK
ncbi:SET domain [Seminavis robusta]|uniref:SET domain n=1 Tax=Seminavis robusta TaxID=568900 RepID=A0A9N8DFA8_9STRA|nr:SET domain [Seminavis robusta]|eukprot:Sro97_g050000.1 SET domain (237) ;mRNA; r:64590-65300